MCRLYQVMQWLARRWLFIVLLLIVATFAFGIVGFARLGPRNTFTTNAYLVVLMFGMNCTDVAKNVGLELEVARWLGFAVWSSTIAAILIRLFMQRWQVAFIGICTRFRRGHVIVAGLGEPGSERNRLVEQMRQKGKDIVAIEPDADHPGLDACRQAGAICLIGSPFERTMMRKGRLGRAGTVLALCEDDRKNITLLSLVASLVKRHGTPRRVSTEEENPLNPSNPNDIGCVVQVSEPRLLEVLRHHNLHRDRSDRLHVRIFNMHELVARAMIRETLVGLSTPKLDRILLVGAGAEGRLGMTLALRAIKDRWIDGQLDKQVTPLELHIHDEKASTWVACLRSEMGKELAPLCKPAAFDHPAGGFGFRDPSLRAQLSAANYDAVYICQSNEAIALIHAATLREFLPEKVPIIVRVKDAGFGGLLQGSDAGGLGKNIRAVGTHDRVFDIATSMNPMIELLAQVIHQDYMLLTWEKIRCARDAGDETLATELRSKKAFVPWRRLADDLKESNRMLADRLQKHLKIPGSNRKFKVRFAPHQLLHPGKVFPISPEELDALAIQEHNEWMAAMIALGWRKGHGQDPRSSGPKRKLNPNLVPWDKLDIGTKEYDRNIIRRLPYVFAKADYEIYECS